MNVEIQMETYNFNFTFSDFLVIVNLKLTNRGQNTYENFHVGLWNNTVVRNVNITPAGSGGVDFYNKGANGYMDSLQLAYCYDAAGDPDFTMSYIGQNSLARRTKTGFHHPELDSTFNPQRQQWEPDDFKLHYNAWEFNTSANPVFFFPSNDAARFQKMTNGLNFSPCWEGPNAAAATPTATTKPS